MQMYNEPHIVPYHLYLLYFNILKITIIICLIQQENPSQCNELSDNGGRERNSYRYRTGNLDNTGGRWRMSQVNKL